MFLPRLTAKPMAGPVTEKRRSEEHRAGIESEVPKRGPAVIDILGREGYHLFHTTDSHHCSFRPGRKENVKM